MEKEKLVEYVVAASVREAAEVDYEEINKSSIAEKFRTAAGAIGEDGKPRMLLLTAFIAHEGRNDNGVAFIREELKVRVTEGLFSPPHAGLIDFDHDFEPRGFWFKTTFAFDNEAEAWGIIATGAIWAWRFPELTDFLLAEQQRNGSVPVSMSELPETVEITQSFPGAEDQHTEINHNPVFFTTSILTLPPGDINARAVVSEDPSKEPSIFASRISRELQAARLKDQTEEETLMEDAKILIEELRRERDDARAAAKVAQEERDSFENQVQEATKQLEITSAEVTELKSKNEELGAKVAEQEVALSSATETKEKIEKDLGEVSTKLEVFEAEKAAAEKADRLEARVEELPEVAQKNLEEHPEKEAIRSAWLELDEDAWETVKQSFALASKVNGTPDYEGLSTKEGPIATGQTKTGGSLLRKHIKP